MERSCRNLKALHATLSHIKSAPASVPTAKMTDTAVATHVNLFTLDYQLEGLHSDLLLFCLLVG